MSKHTTVTIQRYSNAHCTHDRCVAASSNGRNNGSARERNNTVKNGRKISCTRWQWGDYTRMTASFSGSKRIVLLLFYFLLHVVSGLVDNLQRWCSTTALCIHSKSTPQHDNSPFWGYKSDAAPWIFVCLCRRNFNASSLQCGMTANWAQPTNQILIFLNATTTLARHNNSLI